MNKTRLASILCALLLAASCDDDNDDTVSRDAATDAAGLVINDGSATEAGAHITDAARDGASDGVAADAASGETGGDAGSDGSLDAATPACGAPSATCAPALGAQIDRVGRPAVNTALTDPFWDNGQRTLADHHARQDRYNEASNPATWGDVELTTGQKARDAIKANLAAYDALDGTSDGVMAGDGCGNQLAYGATYKGTAYADYSLLTTVLVDDRLYVNTASGTCTTYLAVEANELGVTNTDCGGRKPTYNTIDITYSALVTGHAVCTTMCDVSNGVTSDPTPGPNLSDVNFPFLGDPLP
jgi:hypothetical protein